MNEVMKTIETGVNKPKEVVNKEPYDPNKGKGKLECLSNEARISELKDQLNGKSFDKGSKIQLLFPDKDCRNTDMTFDLANQIISYKGKEIKLNLPKDASINKVSFDSEGINIEGKVAFFTGSGKATYEQLISSIDKVMKDGNASFNSNSGPITLAKL